MTQKNITSTVILILNLAVLTISIISCYRSNLLYKHVNSVYAKTLEANDTREKLLLAKTPEQRAYFQRHLSKIAEEINVLHEDGDALRKKWF